MRSLFSIYSIRGWGLGGLDPRAGPSLPLACRSHPDAVLHGLWAFPSYPAGEAEELPECLFSGSAQQPGLGAAGTLPSSQAQGSEPCSVRGVCTVCASPLLCHRNPVAAPGSQQSRTHQDQHSCVPGCWLGPGCSMDSALCTLQLSAMDTGPAPRSLPSPCRQALPHSWCHQRQLCTECVSVLHSHGRSVRHPLRVAGSCVCTSCSLP